MLYLGSSQEYYDTKECEWHRVLIRRGTTIRAW
jgi:hypothetical protein